MDIKRVFIGDLRREYHRIIFKIIEEKDKPINPHITPRFLNLTQKSNIQIKDGTTNRTETTN